jgi:putative transposase
MIDPTHNLSIAKHARILSISRDSVYYQAEPVCETDLNLMRRIHQLHLDYPFSGSRMLQSFIVREGFQIGRLHVRTYMKRMEIVSICRPPYTSKPALGHKIYPYLLHHLVVERPNQIWVMDITYIRISRCFVYLAATVDWFSLKLLDWRISITLDTAFFLEAVKVALARY